MITGELLITSSKLINNSLRKALNSQKREFLSKEEFLKFALNETEALKEILRKEY